MSKDSLQLPKTAFSMKASLPTKEPEILKKWDQNKIFEKLRKISKGKEKFVLHDGPPYANGHIHMGTALNKILKDMISRFHQMDGKDSIYVPGWDCHGLPIEWKIEEQYKKKKRNKDDVPIKDFRQECREFAKNWIDVHIKEFKRLGVVGYFENYYSTMSFEAEAQIVRELGKFLLEGSLYDEFSIQYINKKGIANLGYRPTFNGQNLLLETNIFGINKNLYNKVISVSFKKFIRGEKKFKDIEYLKKQIKIDIKQAKK